MFNWFNNKIQKFFGISKTEANGLLVLYLFMIILIFSPFFYRQFDGSPYSGFVEDSIHLDSLIRLMEAEESDINQEDKEAILHQRRFLFDPNQATYNELLVLGFDTVVSKRIIKYRNKGGYFRTREDLLRIYGLSEDFYSSINRYIDLPLQQELNRNTKDKDNYEPSNVPDKEYAPDTFTRDEPDRIVTYPSMDINEADTVQLKQIRGIGSVYSQRIIKYRDLLGGFVHLDQLDEVYGLGEGSLQNLRNSLFVDTQFVPVKININFAEWTDLVRHPYINSDLANAIIDTRSANGPYREVMDIQKISIINDSILNQIKPYIKF